MASPPYRSYLGKAFFIGLILAAYRCKKASSMSWLKIWWRGTDSNHRRQCRQIYSLLPLATREPLRVFLYLVFVFPTRKTKFEYGGGGRIRTIEGSAGRFTVCSLWPLGNPSRVFLYLSFVFPTHHSSAERIIANS